MHKIFNNKNQKSIRKKLRSNMPPAEIILWSRLKKRQLKNFKFRRQYSINQYVVDFYCAKAKLVIEIDGESHMGQTAEIYDTKRQTKIESLGLKILRFTNWDIYDNLNEVLEAITIELF